MIRGTESYEKKEKGKREVQITQYHPFLSCLSSQDACPTCPEIKMMVVALTISKKFGSKNQK